MESKKITREKTDDNAINALEKSKAFTGDSYNVYRITEVLYIDNILFYHVEATKDKPPIPKADIYYNSLDGKLYSYENGKLEIFQ